MADLNRLADLLIPGIRGQQERLEDVIKYLDNMAPTLRKFADKDNWLPIDTVPKDPHYGPFLVYDAEAKHRKIKIAEWFSAGSASGIKDISGGGMRRDVTHWMPLPKPPVSRET